MKGTGKITLIVVLAMVMNLFAFTGVYAADVIHSTIWWNAEDAEVSVLSMDVKITSEAITNRYSLHITASAQNNLTGKQNGGMLALCNGSISFKPDGSWINNGLELAEGTMTADININEWNNIILKHKRETGEVEIYLNNNYVGKYTLTAPCTLPINAVSIIADATITTGCEVKTLYARGAKEGRLGVETKDTDIAAKSFTLEFSEKLANPELLSNVVLKNTNVKDGEVSVALTGEKIDDTTYKYTWTDELQAASEYAIVIPENLTGVTGVKAENLCGYITTEKYASSNVKKSDYEDYNNNVDVTVLQSQKEVDGNMQTANPPVIETATSNGKALNVDLYLNNTASNKWLNWTQPTGDITSVSFDIMPLFNDLQMAIEFSNTDMNSTPVYVAFSEPGKIVSGWQWPNVAWYTSSAISGNWSQDGTCGEYKQNEWIRFKIVFNDATDTATLYINGVEAKSFEKKITNVANIFGGIRFRGMNETRSAGTPILLLDNVKSETLSLNASVNQVRFADRDGVEAAPFEKLDKQLGSVKLSFNTAMENSNKELESAVKLYYGEKNIAYSGVYDDTAKTYTITPAEGTYAPSNARIKVVVTEAADKDGNKTSGDFYVTAGEFDSSFDIALCDSNGEETEKIADDETYYVYVNSAYYGAEPAKANILIAQYNNKALIGVTPLEIELGGAMNIDKDHASAISFTADANADMVKVFAWKDMTKLIPWTKAEVATAAE